MIFFKFRLLIPSKNLIIYLPKHIKKEFVLYNIQTTQEPPVVDFSLETEIIANLRLASTAAAKSDPEMSRYFSGMAATKEVQLGQRQEALRNPKLSRREMRKFKKMRFKPNFNNNDDDYDGDSV